MLTPEQHHFYNTEGYFVARQLFAPDEVACYKDHYMRLRAAGSYPGDVIGVNASSNDPLKKYPRMIHMHRWDELSLQWLVDARINAHLTALCGGYEPFAVQTMLYFKPPQARGQALHQDQFYLRVQPSTCVAAWLALDDCDEANGCLQVVPGSHAWPVLCTVKADTTQSFTDVTVPIPPDQEVRPIVMQAGDVMFFNGQLVHGSFPNQTTDRFRRSLIGHYVQGDGQAVYKWYHPVYNMRGEVIAFGESPSGSQCGIWVERDGTPTIEMTDLRVGALKSE